MSSTTPSVDASWSSTWSAPAESVATVITTKDRLVRPVKQRALARALGATIRELAGDYLAPVSRPDAFAARTVELVMAVATASSIDQPTPMAGASPSPDAA